MGAAAPIIGSVAGALISRKGGSSTQVQQADPWVGVQPALSELYSSALGNFRGPGPQYYPGSTVAPQSDTTQLAQQRIQSRALQPNLLLRNAQTQNEQTMRGDYLDTPAMQGLSDFAGSEYQPHQGLYDTAGGAGLNANPYVDSMFNRAADSVGQQFSKNVMPGIASMFAGAGRFGSNQMAEGLDQAQGRYGDVLSKLATDIYGGNFAREREMQQNAQQMLGQFGLADRSQRIGALGELGSQFGRERLLQTQATTQAPSLAQADYFDLGQLANLGAAKDAYGQSTRQADIDRWNFNQQAPRDELAFLASILKGAPMGSTTSVQDRGNPWAGALGGFQLGQSMFQQPAPNPQYQGFMGTSLAPFFYGAPGYANRGSGD